MPQDIIIRIIDRFPRPIKNALPYKTDWFIQFVKFTLVGITSSLINLAILYTLTEFFLLFYLYSAAIALFISAINGYVLNHNWTFKTSNQRRHRFSFPKYISLNTLTYFLNLAVLAFLVESFGVWYIFAEIIAILVALFGNFIGSRYWVFK